MPEFHDIYRRDEDAIAEGNPAMALLQFQTAATRPVFWLQGIPDIVHDYFDSESNQSLNQRERFCALYRSAGGDIDLIRLDYDTPEKATAMVNLVPVLQQYLG